MFDAVLNWFNNALNFVIKWFSAVYKYGHSAWVWVAAIAFGLTAMLTDTFKWLTKSIYSMSDQISTMITGVNTATGQASTINSGSWPMDSLALLNYFFPVNEFLTCTTLLFGVWLLALVIRMIKSLIPTVS